MARDLNVTTIRSMEADEIETRIKGLEEELFNLRFRNAMKQLENPLEIRNVRRDLARLKTVLKQHRSGVRPVGV
jgi:large subunit ribosomal protein L29